MPAGDVRFLTGLGQFRFESTYAPPGQPVMIRMWGIPTMPGYRIKPGMWNIVLKPVGKFKEWWQRLSGGRRVFVPEAASD